MQPFHESLQAVFECPSECRRGEIEDEGVHAGVKGAGEQCVHSPIWTGPSSETHHMGYVVGHEADDEDEESAKSEPDRPEPLLGTDVR